VKSIKSNTFIAELCIIIFFFLSPPLYAGIESEFDDALISADKIRSSNPKEFLTKIKQLNSQKEYLSFSQQQYLDYLNIYLLTYQGELKLAINKSKALLQSNATPLLKFRARISLVNIYANNQNWSEGLSSLTLLLKELPEISDEKNSLLALNVASVFYNQLGQYDLGLHYAQKLESKAPPGRNLCFARGLVIESLARLNQLEFKDYRIDKALQTCREAGEILITSFINAYVSRMYIEKEQINLAVTILESSMDDTVKTHYPRIIAEYFALLANAYWKSGNPEKSFEFAHKALENEKKMRTTQAKILSNKLLYEIAILSNNHELALKHHREFAEADKVHLNEVQAKHLAFQLAEHQAFEQESKISLLNEKNALLEANQALSKAEAANTRLIILVLIVSLLLIIFWGGRLYRAHKRIKELAEFDALTGIFNRGHFTHVATSALRYCQNANQDISLIMFDLDHFKSINDNYGHAVGDWALKETIKACQSLGRQNDIFARLGGEEFCILLPSCNIRSAALRAEECRNAIEEIITEATGHDFKITASFGITDSITSSFELEKLLADADEAAYQAKHSGRNKVVVFENKKPEEKNELDNTWRITS